MSARGWLNLALALAVAVLGALAWFKPGAPDPDAGRLPVFAAPAAAHSIRVTLADGTGWQLTRGAGAWSLAAPFASPADPALVGSLLDDLGAAKSGAHYAASALDPKQVGLDKPVLVLELDAHRYEFGGVEPIDYKRYVKDGDRVLMVDNMAFYRLDQPGAAFASKRLLPDGAQPTKLELPSLTLASDAGGRWTLTPADARVSSDAIQALVEAWRHAGAIEVKPIAAGVVQGKARITLAGVATPLEFEVLTAAEGLRLARRDLGLEYELQAEDRGALLELTRTPALPIAPAPPTAR